ncbi:MAG: DNA repair protein RadA [Candidatus Woesebacteria bacterium]|nr:MAG: DNA repair protein RadA [Candidatus Woesebacteria bacterium]
MAKARSSYVCQQCGYSQVGWSGKCPNCGAWSSMVETVLESDGSGTSAKGGKKVEPILLSSVNSKKLNRVSTKISELDRVLGGGLVLGQVILLSGEPGIGKSTILLQVCDNLDNCLYASSEESVNQIKIRADRLKVKNKSISIIEESDIDSILSTVTNSSGNKKTSALVIDSIQTVSTSDLSGMAGSVGQVRESTYRIVRMAKKTGIPTFIVGHVTKEGNVAGPATLAHLVDTVLWFEGDKNLATRMIRAYKNRYGATDEVGIFEMKENGLESVANLSDMFLDKESKRVSGTCGSVLMEGTRPIIVEIQSLIVPTKLMYPRRVVQGIEARRIDVILAVLERRCGIPIQNFDVFVNVVGGINIREPGADLAIALCIASSYFDKAIPSGFVCFGEVGLLGEIRGVFSEAKRVKEAKRLGYKMIASPKSFSYVSEIIKRFLRK